MGARVRGISSMATRSILTELAAGYQARTGVGVAFESVGGVDAAKRLRAGEIFDVVVLAEDAMKRLEAEGVLLPEASAPFVRSAMAMAIRAGADRPDRLDEASMRDMVLAARAIAFSTGPSGMHVQNVFKAWKIDHLISDRIIQAPPGVPVASLIARGDADLGFQQLSELLDAPGITILRDVPSSVQSVTTFVAGVCVRSTKVLSARAFIQSLISDAAHEPIHRFGMEPAGDASDHS